MRVTALVAGLAVGASPLAACRDEGPPTRHVVTMRYSSYRPAVVTVPRGRDITILLRNDDPIGHEWIVGDDATHARHRTGSEPVHDSHPTEVSVPPLGEVTTVVRFDQPGDYRFLCHLPGHEAYGMSGVLRVV